ncbi:MAG: DNA repair ATPase [Pseudomonadales bacterium]|nr:DNA repair ATPase [Pseudomonadales bacterium]
MAKLESGSENLVDAAVAEGGAYELIRKRLVDQGNILNTEVQGLNALRLQEFGSADMDVIARVRVRSENNCVARDMVQIGDKLLFGYNVFIGLKKETKLEDVFSLFNLKKEGDEGCSLASLEISQSFLSEPSFVSDFEELYRYYKNTKLVELTVKDGKLLAGFQIGERLTDKRVFRWAVSADGADIKYIDNRGERDIQLPPAFDFEWTETRREDVVHGRHAHINILDTVFVETIGGDLTIKVEDNTEDGLGIYREKVEDKTQSLDDGDFFYAQVGELILLKIRPYREEQWRYLVFNILTQDVLRIDAIGESCIQLPEDHGIIFPGGYYLQSGEVKTFDDDSEGFTFKRQIRSPNGEDVLYVFYNVSNGAVGLFAYNLIEKKLQNPILGHGYALAEDGVLVIFSAEDEPTRIHPMQIWQTPYVSAEFASNQPASQSFLGKIGNAELVRGVSDIYSICRMIENQGVSQRLYEELSKEASKIFDSHYWLADEPMAALEKLLKKIAATAELVIDEFAKVQSIQAQSGKTMQQAEADQSAVLQSIRHANWESAEDYVQALASLRAQRGHLTTIKEYRYIDVARIEILGKELIEQEEDLSQKTVLFLSDEKALQPYFEKIDNINKQAEEATTIALLDPIIAIIETTASGLDLLSELMSSLKVDDATVRTRIIDAISEVYAKLNQSKANAKHTQKALGSSEAVAQFSAQFKLFSQSITNALGLATSPELCDEQLSRLLMQLEELESQFSQFDEFLSDIMDKREEVYESFESHKQQLLDQRQRKAQSISDAAARILASIEKRSLKYNEADKLNTYFASDGMVMKVRDLVADLRVLDAAVKADEIESRFVAIKEQALRSLRDKTDIYEDGGNVIKLGPRHKFSVNTQDLDLTIIPREGELYVHLTGTNYFEKIDHAELLSLREFWDLSLESETDEVYRAEYLAFEILQAAEKNAEGLSSPILKTAMQEPGNIAKLVRDFAAPRYKEGYEKGIHDSDAVTILSAMMPVMEQADLLRFDPLSRALAQVFWANISTTKDKKSQATKAASLDFQTWQQRSQSALLMQKSFNSQDALELLSQEIVEHLSAFIDLHTLTVDGSIIDDTAIALAADYLVQELSRASIEFVSSKYALQLVDELKRSLDDESWSSYQSALDNMLGFPAQRWDLSQAWLQALITDKKLQHLQRYIPEAVALINSQNRVQTRSSDVDVEITVANLMGDHRRIKERNLHFALDEFLQRLQHHKHQVIPAYHNYLKIRQNIIADEREKLRLEEFKAKPLSSFVRNRLINEAYLPIIGDNLAKQMGTLGENKRSDLMGLLMMISPPGYGKTTLMEYVASRLGLIFMKINCPSLGHDVLSLDPSQAPNATAAQELIKLNLALEMGNNVMLYLDDIQHTHAEFLQKFISLCDGTRRIEGIWKGKSKTYDMRGKKFCVVMAGNPYTESGEAFKVPDMLANRADIYNLGDILGGMDEQFALSYIENGLTSNAVLAPMALREMDDVYKLVDMAKGRNIASTDLSHQYSGAEINEITDVLRKLFVVQDVILKINMQYIKSAAQDDKYRTEPAFKLQGSYRNMNKMAEKVSAVMNEDELLQMIADHYVGEAQLLTSGAEGNLLKLAELRGNMTEPQQQRWAQIKQDFLRNKAMGGDDSDVGGKVVAQLVDLVNGLKQLSAVAEASSSTINVVEDVKPLQIDTLSLQKMAKILAMQKTEVNVVNQPVPGMDKILTVLAETIEHSIFPLVKSMDKKLDIDLKTHDKMLEISEQLRFLEGTVKPKKGEQ